MKKLEAELKGKAQIERENREIYLEQIKLKSEEQRKTVLESIKTAGSVIGTGFTTLLENPNKILLAVSENKLRLKTFFYLSLFIDRWYYVISSWCLFRTWCYANSS
jgi:hypothetical protein